MPQIVSFDPVNLLIIPVDSGGDIEIDVSEVYSEWKVWVKDGDNAKYPRAMRYVGADPISDTQSLGSTYFLLNGWKFRPVERNHTLTITGNIFTDPAGGSISVPTLGTYTVVVRSSVSNLVDVVTGGEGSSLTASEVADAVWDEPAADHITAGSVGLRAADTKTAAQNAASTASTIDSKADIIDANVDQALVDIAALEEFTPTDRTTLNTAATDAASAKTAAQSADSKATTIDAKVDIVDSNVDQALIDIAAIEEFTPTDRTTLDNAATSAANAETAANTAATNASLAKTAADNALAEAEVARKILHNRLEVDFTAQELVLYDDDGTSIYLRWPLDTDAGENVQAVTGAQTKRGVPV